MQIVHSKCRLSFRGTLAGPCDILNTERDRGAPKVSAACLQFEDGASGFLQSSADAADDASPKRERRFSFNSF